MKIYIVTNPDKYDTIHTTYQSAVDEVQEINSSRYNRTQQNIEARRPLRVTRKQAIRTITIEDGAAVCGKWGRDHPVSQAPHHEHLTLTISRGRTQIDGNNYPGASISKCLWPEYPEFDSD